MKVIGLMSGTSVDGIDAALVEISGTTLVISWSDLSLPRFLTIANSRCLWWDEIIDGRICRTR
jgi:1,6-anhydro-N-acetylmuramate kinase